MATPLPEGGFVDAEHLGEFLPGLPVRAEFFELY